MKISIFALAALASSVSAEFSLRASINSILNSVETEAHDAHIMVSGIRGPLNELEADRISKEAKIAYNIVFGFTNAGRKLGDIKTRGFSKVPPDACWWDEENTDDCALVNTQVDVLYYNEPFSGVSQFGDLHKQFEQELCERLRKSEMVKFSTAKDCTFSFVEHSGLTNKGPVEAAYTKEGGTSDAQLMLVGLMGEMSKEDVNFLSKVVTESHNKAFKASGLSVESFQTLAQVRVGKANEGWLDQCPYCCRPDDDDRHRCPDSLDDVTIVAARINGATVEKSVNTVLTEISHADFENLVCLELRSSGHAVFEQIHDCSFHFVYNPAAGGQVLSGM